MTQTKRPAPNPEWLMMYRRGIPTSKIAAGAGVAESTVRYHIAIAARRDPGLRAAHQAAATPPPPRITAAGQRNLVNVLAIYASEGRLPVSGRSRRESALATWLNRRRKDAAGGTLSPAYGKALDEIPGWRQFSTKQADDDARWERRLAEVAAYRAAGNDWPRHNKTDDRDERTLGVWLHTQLDHRAGKLTAAKEAQLNEVIPGWREGRARRGSNSRRSGRHTA